MYARMYEKLLDFELHGTLFQKVREKYIFLLSLVQTLVLHLKYLLPILCILCLYFFIHKLLLKRLTSYFLCQV